MQQGKTGSNEDGKLRKKAEQRLSRKLKKEPKSRKPDTDALIHELQVHQVELEMQNETLRNARGEIEESRARYVDLYDSAPVGYLTLDGPGLVREVNLTAARLLGVERMFLTGKPFTLFVKPGHQDVFYLHRQKALLSEQKETCEIVLKRKDDTTFDAQLESIAAQVQGQKVVRTVLTDIRERKRAEETLKASLREKETLLKEIHHRVKNNLQVMSSLFNLQAQYLIDPAALDALKASTDRIKTMALIHDKLYRSETLSSIYFPGYLGDLTHDLISAYAAGRPIVLNLDVDPVSFGADTAVPLGLIVNELVTNSLKHGFPGEEGGMITIGLYGEDDRMTLVVSDTGVGFSEDLDFRETQSMGMQLVMMLVEQLEGTIELIRAKGTEFRVIFRKPG